MKIRRHEKYFQKPFETIKRIKMKIEVSWCGGGRIGGCRREDVH
jgi:hypothetical protein